MTAAGASRINSMRSLSDLRLWRHTSTSLPLIQGVKEHINYYALSLPLSLLISQNPYETWVQQPAAEQRGPVVLAAASWRGQLCGQFVAKRRHA